MFNNKNTRHLIQKTRKVFYSQVKTSLKFPMPDSQDRDTMECSDGVDHTTLSWPTWQISARAEDLNAITLGFFPEFLARAESLSM